MNKILVNLFLGAIALSFATVASAATDEAKATYKAAKDNASEMYKTERAKCDSLKDNPKDVCIEEAKAAEKRSKAEAEAMYKNTPKARMNARVAAADADYAVAKEKCNAQSGNAKDVCVKEAKAAQKKAVVDAKSSKEIGEVKTDAKEDKSDADYSVAIKKCDSMSGPAKDAAIPNSEIKSDRVLEALAKDSSTIRFWVVFVRDWRA